MIETRDMRLVSVVIDCGSYSRAADILHLSQPAISRRIAALETLLGATLFRRHGHGVVPTDAGRMLHERATTILQQVEQAEAEIRDGRVRLSGVLRFALPPGAGQHLLPPLLARFGREHPNVMLRILGGHSGHIHEWLAREQVDVACIHDPPLPRGFKATPLVEEQVYVAARPGAFPPGLKHVTAAALAGMPLILPSRPNATRRLLDDWLARYRIAPRIALEVNEGGLIRALVKHGAGFTLLSSGALDADRRHGELDALPLRPAAWWQLTLVTPTKSAQSDMIAAFLRAIRAEVRDLTRSGAWSARSLV